MDVLQRAKATVDYVTYELKLRAFMQDGTCLYDFIKNGALTSDNDVIENILLKDMSETNMIVSDPAEWFKILKNIYYNRTYVHLKIMFDKSFVNGYKLCWEEITKLEDLHSFNGIINAVEDTDEAWFGSTGYKFDIKGTVYDFAIWIGRDLLAHVEDDDMWRKAISGFKQQIREYKHKQNEVLD